jgi:hypothetical protein
VAFGTAGREIKKQKACMTEIEKLFPKPGTDPHEKQPVQITGGKMTPIRYKR